MMRWNDDTGRDGGASRVLAGFGVSGLVAAAARGGGGSGRAAGELRG